MPKCAACAVWFGALLLSALLASCLNPMPDDFPSDKDNGRPPGNFGGSGGAAGTAGPVGAAGASMGTGGGGGTSPELPGSSNEGSSPDGGVPDAGTSTSVATDAGADAAVDAGSGSSGP